MRHRDPDFLTLVILAMGFLILPLGIKGFGYPSPWGPHYLMLLLPIFFILIAAPLGDFVAWARMNRRNGALAAAVLLVLSLLLYDAVTSMLTLAALYQ